MANVSTWSELEKALKKKAEEVVLEKLKNGDLSEHCSVCKSKQVIKLVNNRTECSNCGNEVKIEAIVK